MITIKWAVPIGCLLMAVVGCKTDPVIPAGGVPLIPPVQDPGAADLCPTNVISFQHQVLPLIVSSCSYSGCHDVATAADDIILDSYDHILREVDPGDPGNSELYESITEKDSDDIMPPPPATPLSSEQISIIRDWISQGAMNTTCGTRCDSTQTSYIADIQPLLQDYCIGCHNKHRADGNVNIESYSQLLPYVENGSLLATIRRDSFFPVMPPTGSQLSTCRVTQIEKWISEGAQNN